MFKKSLLTILTALFLNFTAAHPALARAAQDADSARKAKEAVAKVGTGPKARVEVRLKDGTKLKGHVAESSEDGFTVADESGKTTRVAYAEVEKVKAAGGKSGLRLPNKDLVIFAGIMGTIFLSAFAAAASAK
ncbi:MAG TPA: hypothetical protein VN282_18775 [Pyrinomonadaceae bacterium]|nr:hypothetical protein [Pyrinomonadaceae bacterium]